MLDEVKSCNTSPDILPARISVLNAIVSSGLASEWYLTEPGTPFENLLLALEGPSSLEFRSGVCFIRDILLGKTKLSPMSRKFFATSVVYLALGKIMRTLKQDSTYPELTFVSCRFLLDILTSGCDAAMYLVKREKMIQETLWMLTSDDRKYRFNGGLLLAELSKHQGVASSITIDIVSTKAGQGLNGVHSPSLPDFILLLTIEKLHCTAIDDRSSVIEVIDIIQLILDNICHVEDILIHQLNDRCEGALDQLGMLEDILGTLVTSVSIISNTKQPSAASEVHHPLVMQLHGFVVRLLDLFFKRVGSSNMKNVYFLHSIFIKTLERVHRSLHYLGEEVCLDIICLTTILYGPSYITLITLGSDAYNQLPRERH